MQCDGYSFQLIQALILDWDGMHIPFPVLNGSQIKEMVCTTGVAEAMKHRVYRLLHQIIISLVKTWPLLINEPRRCTLAWGQMWNFIECQTKFNRFSYQK